MVSYQEAPSPPMTPALQEACAGAMHVILPDGSMQIGDKSVIYVYETLGYGIASVFRYPPLSWVTPSMYRLLANNRRTFARFVFRDEG